MLLCVVIETEHDITNHLEGKDAIGWLCQFVKFEITVKNVLQSITKMIFNPIFELLVIIIDV